MRRLTVGLCLLLAAAPRLAHAVPPDSVVARSRSVVLTTAGLRALVAALPPDARARVAGDPAALAEVARSAIIQSLLLGKARAEGWDKRPEIAAAADRARQSEIVRSFIANEITPPEPPTDTQLQQLYDANKPRFMLPRQFHLAQIFLALPANAAPAAVEQKRRQLADLRARCEGKTEAFAVAAKQFSDDTRSNANGGDLGWIADDKLVAPIKKVVSGLQVGSLSEPLRTDDGWHLLELTGTKAAGPASFAQARPVLAQAYMQQQSQLATQTYLDLVLQHDPVEMNQATLQSFGKNGGSQ